MTDLSADFSALNLASTILGELGLGGPRQHERLLRLHTTLGPDVLVAERAEVTQAIGPEADRIELLALSARHDIDAAALLGQPMLLELLTAHSRTALRPFHGHVTHFELLGSDGGLSRYRVVIEPWLALLRHRVDAWVFQDKTVLQILAELFADYAGQGALSAAFRFDVQDESVYPVQSSLAQFNESDLAFASRLMADNGLFCWWEHAGKPTDTATLGSHTLVIADHNGACLPGAQERIRFTQSSAVIKEDSITQWHGHRRVGVSTLHTASWDYRVVDNHAASDQADAGHGQPMALAYADQPGAYAFETAAEAQRIATVQMQAFEAQRKQFKGQATVRTLAPATSFVLLDHADHDRDRAQGGDEAARFVVLSVVHRVRNNLSADAKAGLQHLLGSALAGQSAPTGTLANSGDEPVYQASLLAQRARIAVRMPIVDARGKPLHPRPLVTGTQTALVVGLGEPLHTDRDGRIKIQFHWQRGARASHRLTHAAGDNAPASDASGTWVRVRQPSAGANWGSVFIPRLGQEVTVAFIEGDIDRPVVTGAVYNGQGNDDAQGNTVGGGAAQATGNAPAWFPGNAHAATLSGFKSQGLDTSQAGMGEHNQLVMDDTPGQGRVLAHTTQSQTWLQMGHLLQQHDNQRLAPRGHGLELHTRAQGALRAGSGLHLSAHGRPGGSSGAQGQPTNTREAQAQLTAHGQMLQSLADNSQTHLAQLPSEPSPDKLKALEAINATLASLKGTQGGEGTSASDDDGSGSDFVPINGGHGSIPITERPDLVLSAPGDIASLTPVHTVVSAGQHTTITTGQDLNILSQRHLALAVKDGISLFTRGEAGNGQRAVQDTGMKLHAATGNVNVQAQSAALMLTAEKAVDIQSTNGCIVISAPSKILLNGGGGYIKIEGGDIELGSSGMATFKGAMKELTGGASASDSVALKKASKLAECPSKLAEAGASGASAI